MQYLLSTWLKLMQRSQDLTSGKRLLCKSRFLRFCRREMLPLSSRGSHCKSDREVRVVSWQMFSVICMRVRGCCVQSS